MTTERAAPGHSEIDSLGQGPTDRVVGTRSVRGDVVSLVPGLGKDGERPPGLMAGLWFERGCLALAFALWSTAMTVPLAVVRHKDGTQNPAMRAVDIYPLGQQSAPGVLSFVVGITFLLIIIGGVRAGMHAANHHGDGAATAVSLTFIVNALVTALMLLGDKGGRIVPYAGLWLIWVANALVMVGDVPVISAAKAAALATAEKAESRK